MTDLTEKRCLACEGGVRPLDKDAIAVFLANLSDWQVDESGKIITRTFTFNNYHEAMAFVNATAWMSHDENHHPDLTVGYNYCRICYTTHAIDGLSENDFICAAKVDKLYTHNR